MFFPICARCKSKNTLGNEICYSCKLTLANAKVINTAIDACNGKKTNAMFALGMGNSKFFWKLINDIPEIRDAWDDDEDDILTEREEPKEIRKVLGSKVLNEATQQEYDWFYKKIFRESDYAKLSTGKQERFIKWLWSQNLDRLSIKDARVKLLEYNGKKEVINL